MTKKWAMGQIQNISSVSGNRILELRGKDIIKIEIRDDLNELISPFALTDDLDIHRVMWIDDYGQEKLSECILRITLKGEQG